MLFFLETIIQQYNTTIIIPDTLHGYHLRMTLHVCLCCVCVYLLDVCAVHVCTWINSSNLLPWLTLTVTGSEVPYMLLAYTLKKYAAPTLRLVTFTVTWAPTLLENGKDWFTYKLGSVDTT